MTSIITQLETIGENILATIITEAKQIASGIYAYAKPAISAGIDYAKEAAGQALEDLVTFVKETTLGTALLNLISAAASSAGSGYDKFAAVLLAGQNAWKAFVDNKGLPGVFSMFGSAFTYVVQKLYERFAATFLKVA